MDAKQNIFILPSIDSKNSNTWESNRRGDFFKTFNKLSLCVSPTTWIIQTFNPYKSVCSMGLNLVELAWLWSNALTDLKLSARKRWKNLNKSVIYEFLAVLETISSMFSSYLLSWFEILPFSSPNKWFWWGDIMKTDIMRHGST